MFRALLKQVILFVVEGVLLSIWHEIKNHYEEKRKRKLDKKIDDLEKKFEKRVKNDEKQILDELDDIDSNL